MICQLLGDLILVLTELFSSCLFCCMKLYDLRVFMASSCSAQIISFHLISLEEVIDSGFQASEHIEATFFHTGGSGFGG